MTISVIHDNSYRSVQVKQVAKILETKNVDVERLILTCGLAVVDEALEYKKSNPDKILVSILDPQKCYDDFDLIFVPEHDPYADLPNIRTTVGLINYITPNFLKNAYPELDSGSQEEILNQVQDMQTVKVAVLIGGKHVGGNFSEDDAVRLANILNSQSSGIMITTSKRTEFGAVEVLRRSLKVPYHLYDFNRDGQAANPYLKMLAVADKIIVTADSVRMCSEAASSGKQVFIFTPEHTHFSYLAMRDCFFEQGAALDVKNLLDNTPTKTLNEAERVARIIVEYEKDL